MGKLLSYIKDVRREFKMIIWPSREETIRYTQIVIVMSLTVGLYLSILDAIFVRVITKIIGS